MPTRTLGLRRCVRRTQRGPDGEELSVTEVEVPAGVRHLVHVTLPPHVAEDPAAMERYLPVLDARFRAFFGAAVLIVAQRAGDPDPIEVFEIQD